jgi:hypothetical protein
MDLFILLALFGYFWAFKFKFKFVGLLVVGCWFLLGGLPFAWLSIFFTKETHAKLPAPNGC